jgi:2-polyprenyl-3-methyl-5-hydroxy-6-metoxy-1,4-benzoquinol methylase
MRVLDDCGAAWRCALFTVGDRLGLFRLMAETGPMTADEFARKAHLNARILREWLNAMVAADYIEYSPADRTYLLTKEHALVLADEETSAVFLGGMFELAETLVSAAPVLTLALHTCKPLRMSDYPAQLSEAEERISAPRLKHDFVQKQIPLMRQVEAKLTNGGSAVDLACGSGLASIILAKAFPKSRFAGYDPYLPAIQTARERTRKEGVSDRVEFVAAGSSELPPGRFDLLTIFASVHHFADPVSELTHCRKALAPGGTCFITDGDLSLNPEDNRNPVGRLAYGASTLYCLHDSMANNGAAFGAEFNEQKLSALATASGFSQFKKLSGTRQGERTSMNCGPELIATPPLHQLVDSIPPISR